jgi:uncharacterized protein YgiM (DUF1202 family)
MKRIVAVLALSAVVSLASVKALYAESVYYVQSVKAKVMSSFSFKATVIAEVGKGTKLFSSGREGNWIKVKYHKKTGYVSALLLSPYPPIAKTGVIKGEETEIKQGVRRRASSYTSAAAARGLTQDDRRRLSKEEKVDYESLEKIESFKLSADEVARFMEGNK